MEATKTNAICINPTELAARWRISHRPPERWRWPGEGPRFLKVDGRVAYRLADVEEFERMMIRFSMSDVGHAHQSSA